MFKCFPLPFCSRNLEQIDKRHCNLTTVPDDVLRYTRTLEDLLLDANQLQDLPKGVYRLTQLRRLTFSDNEIQRILPEIGQLVNLEELDCSRNDIAEIPDNIRHCRSLQKLDFSGNPLANNLPSGIIHLRQLSQLILNDVSLAELPKEIGSLSNLRVLEMRENLLKILPDSLVQLTKLESLDLGSNAIEQLPNHIGYLQSLKELWLDSNELIELPNDIGQLKNLQCLDVSENKLTYLPNEIGDLESLTNFELSSNQVEEIPITIGKLKQRLLILKINSNSLNKLCEEIGYCLALTELILTENTLNELPKTIGNLKHLSNLNVDRNQLTYLPTEISGCESLGLLSLRDNRLTQIPSELSKLKHLHVLDLSGNRLLNLPCTLLDCDLKAIWLAENQAQPMLKFATDIDSNTGEKVITCYLLPQQQYTTSSMENLLNTSKCQNVNGEVPISRQIIHSPHIQDEDLISDDRHERTGSVKFADEAEELKESSLQRHNTPHPKDLRTWRYKMAKKLHTDGNILHHDHQHPYQPNAHTHSDSSHPSISSGTSLSQTNRPTKDSAGVVHDSIDYIPPEISLVDRQNSDNEDDENSGEHMGYIEKHVEFTDDYNNNDYSKESQMQQKLHRRDTPHHLKNKRIITQNNDSMTLNKIMSNSPTKSSITSGRNDSISPSLPSNNRPITVHYEQITFNIHRTSNTGLGISIAGGMGSSPYKDNDHGIFLTKVTEEGPAGQAGLLVGDKLLTVNGISLINSEHSEAVNALKKAGDHFEIIIVREILQASNDYLTNDENSSTMNQHDEQLSFSIPNENQTITTNGNDNVHRSKSIDQNSLISNDHHLSINGHDQTIDMINNEKNTIDSTVNHEKLSNGNENSLSTNIDNMIEEARVAKGNGPMGLSIVGGIDQACPPFGMDQRGVFVSKILPSGSASRTNLRIGDRILKVNNQDITQATHLEAVQALLQPTSEVVLLVRHEPQPIGLKEVILKRQSSEALGIRINGGVDGKHVHPDDPEDDGIFVTEVKDNSPASGILTIGNRILEAVNCSCSKRWFCLSHKSPSSSSSTIHSPLSSISSSIDQCFIRDYCETSIDDIVNLKGILTFEKLSSFHIKRTRSNGYIRKKQHLKKYQQRRTKSCCLSALFQSTKKNFYDKKKDLTCTQQILAPIVTLKDLISSSFSLSSSASLSSDDKAISPLSDTILSPTIKNDTPSFSCKSLSFDPSLSIISTPKSLLVHSYTSLSNYRIKTNITKRQYSLEEQIHNEECTYCAHENALPLKFDSNSNNNNNNNNNFEKISLQSFNLIHAVEMYLSSNNTSHDLFDISSLSSEQHATIQETKQLNLCEINEIIYAIHSDIDNNNERNEILDSLASSLRQVAEETPIIPSDEQILPINNIPEPPQPPGLGQILARAVMYDIVNNQSLFGARLDDAQKWLSAPNESIHLLICYGFKPKEITSVSSSTYSLTKKSKTNDPISPSVLTRPLLTQQPISPIPSIKPNGISNPSLSPKSSQPPPVPAKPKLRSPNNQSIPINGDNQTAATINHSFPTRIPAHNGFDIDESDISVTESERSFKDKKKFFESGFKDPGPRPKPRQFKYINEHELLQMKKEDEQKVKSMSPTELLQSRTMYDNDKNDPEFMQTTLSQYHTPTYLAKRDSSWGKRVRSVSLAKYSHYLPEEDDDDIVPQRQSRNISSSTRVTSLERNTASARTMLSKIAIESGMT
ncbi:unnamed protein product [Adineta steineri]|uniref:PDZ domain-containing protein n=1 Tax=Adineta steineri TaxID=433720 RepID=A0A814D3Z5_9BILA|nr:unnamed protein product [Adineta steineri]CAF0948077.1 unnamed protein product [Adineta steineri]